MEEEEEAEAAVNASLSPEENPSRGNSHREAIRYDDDEGSDDGSNDEERTEAEAGGEPDAMESPALRVPPGLRTIYEQCRGVYPEQGNPLQVTAIVKYWLGGPDPLDYISMYRNGGGLLSGGLVEEHWHYVSFGLSDLYGDQRVHPLSGPDSPSGFGFELSFRLKREPGETAPPTWPAELMQGLARYVFQSENRLCSGDHVSWHAPLDGHDSRIQHMLLTDDPQLTGVTSSLGYVAFLQIVGVCNEELQAAQQWNGPGVIDILKSVPAAGGPWLVTDMRRGESVFDIDPQLQERVDIGVEREGSNLSGVSGRVAWARGNRRHGDRRQADRRHGDHGGDPGEGPRTLSHRDSVGIRAALRRGLGAAGLSVLPPIAGGHQQLGHLGHGQLQPHGNSTNHERTGIKEEPDDDDDGDEHEDEDDDEGGCPPPLSCPVVPPELVSPRRIRLLHLLLNLESGALLPLALRGRLLHGRHFTFKDVTGDSAVTLVSPGVTGAIVGPLCPYVSQGPWLQVLLPSERVEEMLRDLDELKELEEGSLPRVFRWPDFNLSISIVPDADFDAH